MQPESKEYKKKGTADYVSVRVCLHVTCGSVAFYWFQPFESIVLHSEKYNTPISGWSVIFTDNTENNEQILKDLGSKLGKNVNINSLNDILVQKCELCDK